MNKREIGTDYELIAADFLKSHGAVIRERNFRCRQGEIDIIAEDEGYLVFVEVKYRKTLACGDALSAVTQSKQHTICKVAIFYMYTHGMGTDTPVRYDVIAIQGNTINWVKNAFMHSV